MSLTECKKTNEELSHMVQQQSPEAEYDQIKELVLHW